MSSHCVYHNRVHFNLKLARKDMSHESWELEDAWCWYRAEWKDVGWGSVPRVCKSEVWERTYHAKRLMKPPMNAIGIQGISDHLKPLWWEPGSEPASMSPMSITACSMASSYFPSFNRGLIPKMTSWSLLLDANFSIWDPMDMYTCVKLVSIRDYIWSSVLDTSSVDLKKSQVVKNRCTSQGMMRVLELLDLQTEPSSQRCLI